MQRPSIESKLLGDVANLKSLANSLKSSLPLDYYTVFAELEKQLIDEFDFVAEASGKKLIFEYYFIINEIIICTYTTQLWTEYIMHYQRAMMVHTL